MDRSKKVYQVWTMTYQGESFVYEGNDEEQFKAAVARLEAENERIRTDNRLWWDKPKEIFTAIIEPAVKAQEEPAVAPVEQTEEQEQVEPVQENPYEIIPQPSFEIAEQGKFEVIAKMAAEPKKVIYRGDRAKTAKAAVASLRGHAMCIQVYTKFEGHLIEYGGNSEWFWDWHTPEGRRDVADAYLHPERYLRHPQF